METACCEKKFSWKAVLVLAWAVVATLVIAWYLLQNGAYAMGRAAGQAEVVTAIYQQATKACQPFPVTLAADKQVGLINVECLKQPEEPKKK